MQYFAYTITAELLWHVQNFMMTHWLDFMSEQNKFALNFNCDVKVVMQCYAISQYSDACWRHQMETFSA